MMKSFSSYLACGLVLAFATSTSARTWTDATTGRVIEAELVHSDGSNATIAYLAEGDKSFPKEYIEIYGEGKTLVVDDFRRASMFRGGKETTKKLGGQDKGQAEEIRAVCAAVLGKEETPISLEDLVATTRATFRIRESIRTGQAQEV